MRTMDMMEMELETANGSAVHRRQVKTPRDIRVALAEHDIPAGLFAEMVGMNPSDLSGVMHNRRWLSEPMRIRIEQAIASLDAAEAARVAAGEPAEAPRPMRYPRIRKL